MSANHRDAIQELYRGFNQQDMDVATAHLGPGVLWQAEPSDVHLEGRAAVRAYWQRQWQQGEAKMAPMRIEEDGASVLRVRVDELIRDGVGNVLVNRQVEHAFTFDGAFISRMDASEVAPEEDEDEAEDDWEDDEE